MGRDSSVAGAEDGEVVSLGSSAGDTAGFLDSATNDRDASSTAEEAASHPSRRVSYSMSPGLVGLLGRLDVSVGFTSYQSGKLYLLGRNPKGGLMVHERLFRKAMGLAADGTTLALATLFQIQRFENVLEADQSINNTYDACYVPRVTFTTGTLDAHEVGLLGDGRIVFVNTRYNCLAVPSTRHSFAPVWVPPFISGLVDEDRCHLNGLAMEAGRPRYVTAVSRSDTIDGWRDRRTDGGVVVDVETGEVVCEGLSMPHSPRLANGKLWVLNSGTGELGYVDPDMKAFQPVTFCPGFVRGLAIRGRYAFVGLSKPRYERFEGLALDERLKAADSEPWCGIQVIDLERGTCVEWFEDGDSLEGRLGLAAGHQQSWLDGDGRVDRAHVYGLANVTYAFLDGTTVRAGDMALDWRPERLWGEVGLGGTYASNDSFALYGEVTAATVLKHFADSYAIAGTLGVRIGW